MGYQHDLQLLLGTIPDAAMDWPRSDRDCFFTNASRPLVTIRPDHLRDANLPADERSINRWFDPDAFAAPPIGTFRKRRKGCDQGTGRQRLACGLLQVVLLFREGSRALGADSHELLQPSELQQSGDEHCASGSGRRDYGCRRSQRRLDRRSAWRQSIPDGAAYGMVAESR